MSGSVYVLIHDELDATSVKTLYESNANTNAFTDAEKTKLLDLYNKSQFDGFFSDIDTELVRLENIKADINYVDQQDTNLKNYIDQFAQFYGWEDTRITDPDLTLTDTVATATVDDYDFVLFQVKDDGEYNSTYFCPMKLQVGEEIKIILRTTPTVILALEKGATNYTFSLTDGSTTTATACLRGVKMVDFDNSLIEKSVLEVEHKIDTIEETLRKVTSSDVVGVESGTDIIPLPIDTANGQMKPTINGMTLQATNLVSSDPIADGASVSFTTENGVDYYVNDGTTSKIITGDGLDYTLTNNTGSSAIMFAYNVDTLKANKQFSPQYDTTFDLMSDSEIVAQMDAWVADDTLPNDNIQSVSGNVRVRSVDEDVTEQTEMYLQPNRQAYSVPNQVKDTIEFRNGRAYFNRTVKLDTTVVKNAALINTSQDDLWTNGGAFGILSTSLTTLGMKSPSANNIIGGVYLVINDETYKVVDFNNFINQDGNNAVSLSSTGVLYLAFNDLATKGITKENTSSAQAYLQENDVSFYYELATPIETEIESTGQLLGHSKGTVYIDSNIIAPQAVTYDTSAVIGNTTYPISTLDKIIKLNQDGSKTELDVANATIAGDGLSFTHTELASGEIVLFTYYYANENSVVGLTDIQYYDNRYIFIDTVTGTAYKIVKTVDNGVINETLEVVN